LVVDPARFLEDLAYLGVGCRYYKNGYVLAREATA
jgi:hypothetical protein